MPYLIIKGVFNPKNGIPDGDSVRFLADDDSLFDQVEGRVEFKAGGEAQLRYEGIDALEKGAIKPLSSRSTKRNIELLGGDKNGLPGYILTKGTDTNGRPISFVFTGNPTESDGSEIEIDGNLLNKSVNYQLLEEGIVYPLFYDTLYKEIRDELVKSATAARATKKGIWKDDLSNKGFVIKPPVDITKLQPIFPKLWRRLEAFYQRPSNQKKPAKEFLASLTKGSDRLFTIPDQRSIKFSTALSLKGDTLKLLYKPEEMIFRS